MIEQENRDNNFYMIYIEILSGYMNICVNTHTHTHTYARTHARTQAREYTHMRTHTPTNTLAHTHAHTRIHTYTHACTHTDKARIHTHVHTHTHTHSDLIWTRVSVNACATLESICFNTHIVIIIILPGQLLLLNMMFLQYSNVRWEYEVNI